MEGRRPQLSPDELQQLKWLLGGVLALFSGWTVIYIDVGGGILLALLTLGVSVALAWPRLPGRIPAWVHQLAFPVIVLVFAGDLWVNGQILPAIVRLDLMLLLYRGVSYRRRRDDLQLIVLGLLLIVVTGVLTVALGFALQILAFTACALAFLLTITMAEAAEAGDSPERTPFFTWGLPALKPSWVAQANWQRLFRRLRDVADWKLLGLGALLFAGVVAVSAVLFISIPRFQLENSLFLDRLISRKSRVGFTENIRLGDVNDITQDNGLALNVDISDPSGVPATVYLRMVVLDEYSGGGFRMSPELRRESFDLREEQDLSDQVRGTEAPRIGPRVYWTFYFEPGISRYLPIPGSFSFLRFQDMQHVSSSPALRLVALRSDPVAMIAYRLDRVSTSGSLLDTGFAQKLAAADRNADGSFVDPDAVELGLSLAAPDRQALASAVAEFAGTSAGPATMSASEFSGRAAQWLADRHTYSLQSTLPAGTGDPLVRWIDSNTPGHCELFAGAFLVLARAAGYPTRLVSGFRGGSWNAFTGSLTVRNNDAHAWCEIWDAETSSWLRVDPTPGATVVATADELRGGAAQPRLLDRSWSARLDSLRILWYRRIVNFDQQTQLQAVRSVREATQATGRRVREAIDAVAAAIRRWLTSPWQLERVIRLLGGVLLLGAVGWLIPAAMRNWRWRRPGTPRPGERDPVRVEAGRWLLRLRGAAVSPEAGANRPEPWAELERLRYGRRQSRPDPAAIFARARQAWRDVRRGRNRGG